MKYPLSEIQAKKHLQKMFEESIMSFKKIHYSDVCEDDKYLQLCIDGFIVKNSKRISLGNYIDGQVELADSEEFTDFNFFGEVKILNDECKVISILRS